MDPKTRLGLALAGAALLLGLLADLWLREGPSGLNFFVWMTLLVGAAAALAHRHRAALAGGGRWLAAPALLFAGAAAWRASPALGALDVLAVLVLLALGMLHAREGRIQPAGVADYALRAAEAGVHALAGPFLLVFADIAWQDIPRRRWFGTALAVARGLLMAIPLLLVFGALFMAADAVFEGLVTRALDLDLGRLYTHVAVTLIWAWLAAGFLRGVFLGRPAEVPFQRPAGLAVGAIEAGMVLGPLAALFLAFVLVQFRYLFGGAGMVQAATGLTYAEYARRGFFELAAVSALVLPVLLAGHWLLRPGDRPSERLYRALAGVLLACLAVIMASALMRMRLYQLEYGLTELRLYVVAFMGWLAAVFAWFAATVLRGRRERFAFGALVAGLAALAVLHIINPDGLVARTNAARHGPRPVDTAYLARLSADAVPAILEALPELSATDRREVAAGLLRRWANPPPPDWRTWNWGRARAYAAVAARRAELEAWSGLSAGAMR